MKYENASKTYERAKVLAALGVIFGGFFGAHAFTLYLSGAEELQLEGVMFLLPKILIIIATFFLYYNPRTALWIYATAAFISVIATILGFTLYSLDMMSFGLHHIPAFIFYGYMIWLLNVYLRVVD